MASFVIGVLSVVGGIAYLLNLGTRRTIGENSSWNVAMIAKGFFGGVGVIAIGIVLMIKYWPF